MKNKINKKIEKKKLKQEQKAKAKEEKEARRRAKAIASHRNARGAKTPAINAPSSCGTAGRIVTPSAVNSMPARPVAADQSGWAWRCVHQLGNSGQPASPPMASMGVAV